MREIRFRVWDGEKMRLLKDIFKNLTQELAYASSDGIVLGKGEAIFEQFTGLQDKNGNPIYEGDRLRKRHCNDGVVAFMSGSFVNSVMTPKGMRHYELNEEQAALSEIIGDIHQELLP